MGDENRSRKKRSITPPLLVEDTIRTKVKHDVALIMESFGDLPTDTRKRIESSLLPEVRDKIRNKEERDHYKTAAEESRSREAALGRKLSLSEWPNKVRGAIFDVEGDMNLASLMVCFQCGFVHTPACAVVKSTSKYPSEVKAQRIFVRRQRWLHAMTTYLDNPRIQRIRLVLQMKFDEIHSQKDASKMNEAEQFIFLLDNFEVLVFWFCQAIADIFEELSNSIKIIGSTSEVENLGIFSAPYDLLATILINSSTIFNQYGNVKLKSAVELNVMATEFVPKENN